MPGTRVLVTGGAGFIGSHLVEALVRDGHRVRVLDDFSSGRIENLGALVDEVEVMAGDCSVPETAARAVRGVEVVFHQAAVPSVARSVEEPLLSHHANASATLALLVAARDAEVRRLIYAGSSSVYGDAPGLPKRETMRPRPLSPYAAAKLAGEHYLRIFARLYGLETLTLRYFNVFGPRQDPSSPYSGVISRFASALVDGAPLTLNGDGRQSRDFTYVANVVEANRLALRAAGLSGQAVNVACGRRVSLRALVAALASGLGREARFQRRPARRGDVRHSLADVGLARRLLGYRPLVEFEEGLRRTLAWYSENRRWSCPKSA